MLPEPLQTKIDLWVLIKLHTNNIPKGGLGKPYNLVFEDVYHSLEEAQQAQTYEALKSSIKYEIFHLEFPVHA